MADVVTEETEFRTWEECVRVSNGRIEVVATTGVGPRVLSCGFLDGENLFFTDPDRERIRDMAYTIHGGHRLWHAPEDEERTYVPDDDPVEWAAIDGGVRLVGPTESGTGIRKSMSLRLAADKPLVEVTHELANEGLWSVELAPWAITVLRPGGTAVVALSRGPDGLLPDRSVALWPYASMADERLTLADEAVLVDGDPEGDGRFKVGTTGVDEWAAYVSDGVGFIKEFAYDDDATYPDRGSAVEVFTDGSVLELETLGPMRDLPPGESAVHTETWRLVADVEGDSAADLRAALAPPAETLSLSDERT